MDFTSLKLQNELIPVIVQDDKNLQVLMMAYMNKEAFEKTLETGLVHFYSRSRQKLWLKGESSGNFLKLVDIAADCDRDSLLVRALPQGPTCHTGSYSCFGKQRAQGYLHSLERRIEERKSSNEEKSYTRHLFEKGINKIAQKVGEESVELIIEAKDDNPDRFIDEAADLMYHFLVLLSAKNIKLQDIEERLLERAE
jgi:phosphoribosyl-ATP pyrophosphohydrolase/phosphoribosyl-AMP cyclohydrolase